MKRKGFTLVELLAVIVILAIIALIAIPLIGNVIEKAKIGSLESSVNGLVESANMYYANNTIKGETVTETIFGFEDGEQVSDKKLEYKGKVYNGKLILHANGKVAVCIDDEEHYAYKNKDTDEIVSGTGTCLYDGTTGDFSSNSSVEDLKQQIAAATATADKVLEGNTIYTSVGLVAGTMTNYSTKTVNATTVTESGENALITIPNSGYYDETSQISVPIETINNQISVDLSNATIISKTETLIIGPGSTTATFSPTITGYKQYKLLFQQTRDAYSMTYTVKGTSSDNIESFEIISSSTNNVTVLITVKDKTKQFSVYGTAYNGDSTNSAANITYSGIGI